MENSGYEAYLVGGCVRDFLMGLTPKDYDICTSALPEEVCRLFSKTIPTGIKHGTVTVVVNHLPFEVTTFRVDMNYTDHRRPDQVQFSTMLIEDLTRRDFTINAIAYHPHNGIIDPFSGVIDLQHKIIRTVGDPEKRFNEDALRMLRAVRFQARFGFCIDTAALNAISHLADTIAHVSRERILTELNGILLSCFPGAIQVLFETGLIRNILPTTALCYTGSAVPDSSGSAMPCSSGSTVSGSSGSAVHGSSGSAVPDSCGLTIPGNSGSAMPCSSGSAMLCNSNSSYDSGFDIIRWLPVELPLRWAAFLWLSGFHSTEEAEYICSSLKTSTALKKGIVKIIGLLNHPLPHTGYTLRRTLSVVGISSFSGFLKIVSRLNTAMNISVERLEKTSELLESIITENHCIHLAELAIDGCDLATEGLPPGKLLGDILDALFICVLQDPALNRKDILLDIAKHLKTGLAMFNP